LPAMITQTPTPCWSPTPNTAIFLPRPRNRLRGRCHPVRDSAQLSCSRKIETTKHSQYSGEFQCPAISISPLPAVGRKDKINEHVGAGLSPQDIKRQIQFCIEISLTSLL
jgi:hypothetical protein